MWPGTVWRGRAGPLRHGGGWVCSGVVGRGLATRGTAWFGEAVMVRLGWFGLG
jgi:hypothetical protein